MDPWLPRSRRRWECVLATLAASLAGCGSPDPPEGLAAPREETRAEALAASRDLPGPAVEAALWETARKEENPHLRGMVFQTLLERPGPLTPPVGALSRLERSLAEDPEYTACQAARLLLALDSVGAFASAAELHARAQSPLTRRDLVRTAAAHTDRTRLAIHLARSPGPIRALAEAVRDRLDHPDRPEPGLPFKTPEELARERRPAAPQRPDPRPAGGSPPTTAPPPAEGRGSPPSPPASDRWRSSPSGPGAPATSPRPGSGRSAPGASNRVLAPSLPRLPRSRSPR